jgi:hypothetical protein
MHYLGTSPLKAGPGRSQLAIRSALLRRSASLAVGPATTPGAGRHVDWPYGVGEE